MYETTLTVITECDTDMNYIAIYLLMWYHLVSLMRNSRYIHATLFYMLNQLYHINCMNCGKTLANQVKA